MVRILGSRVGNFGFRIQGLGFRVKGEAEGMDRGSAREEAFDFVFRSSGFGVISSDTRLRFSGFGFRASEIGFWYRSRISGFGVSGFGFRVFGVGVPNRRGVHEQPLWCALPLRAICPGVWVNVLVNVNC
jgi:hypothetical protein